MVGFKNRYMVLELVWQGQQPAPDSWSVGSVSSAIQESLLLNFGELGLGASITSLQVKYLNPFTNLCVVRCGRGEYRKVWAAITFITAIRKLPVLFNLLDLSGSVRACRKKALEYDKERLRQQQLLGDFSLDPGLLQMVDSTIEERIAAMER